MKIEQFDRPTLKFLRKELAEALKPVEEKLGLTIHVGNCTYDTSKCSFKLDMTKEGETVDQINFMKYCHLYGFKKEDFGRNFQSNGKTYCISGLLIKASKYPILATCKATGKEYKFRENIKDRLK